MCPSPYSGKHVTGHFVRFATNSNVSEESAAGSGPLDNLFPFEEMAPLNKGVEDSHLSSRLHTTGESSSTVYRMVSTPSIIAIR